MTKIIDRTYPMGQAKAVGIANIGAGNGLEFAIPIGAILVRVIALTTVAFNSATTTTLTIGDGTTTFVNAVDIKSTGSEAVANVPKYYPAGGTLSVTLAETGAAATAGEAFVYIEYVRPGNGIAGVQE